MWTADNGLPQNILRDLCQTPDGYLWVVTLDGLARFDGVRFTVFNKLNSPGIASNRFTRLYEDRKGDLWLATEATGVTRYHEGRFVTYTTHDGLPNNSIQSTIGDESGNVWVLAGNSIAQWDEAAGRFRDVTPQNPAIHYDRFLWESGGLWGSDGKQLYLFVQGVLNSHALPDWLRGQTIRRAAADQNGAIWLETTNGQHARMVDGHFERAPKSAVYRDRLGNLWTIGVGPYLGRYMIYRDAGHKYKITFVALREDREGDLWLASEGQGLYRAPRKFVTTYSQEEGLIDRVVYPVFQDHDGDIWIGAWSRGLSRWHNGRFTNYTKKDGLADNFLTALGEDTQGRLWTATSAGLSVFERGSFRAPPGPVLPAGAVVQTIFRDRQGTLWFGSGRGLIRYKDGVTTLLTVRDGLVNDDVRVIAEGHSGDLWIGGYGGITRLRNGAFTRWTERDGLPSNAVRTIYEDAQGVVWIGTYDGGLGRLENGRFTRYTTQQGLFNNGVFRILEDARGNFWMSSNRGIYRVSKQELNEFAAGSRSAITSVSYGRSDGMRNEECNGGSQPAGIQARDGKLWFPTQDGVAVIDPETVPANPQAPPIEIESLLIDRTPAAFDHPLRIAADKTNLEIQYTALSFIDSGQIRFRYRLQALDSGWVEAGARRTAYYSHIPPGEYAFTVIASNRDGVWNNEGKSLQITVLAPFYRTWWFESLVAVGVALLVAAAWRYRVAQLERHHGQQQAFSRQLIASQENERKRIAVELHDSLGQHLVVIKNLALFFLRAQSESRVNGHLHQIEEISAEASLAIDETREISYNLRPFQLDRLGLTKAIQAMIRTTSTASGITFTSELANIDDVFAEEMQINFYRIVQESLNNIAKHASATEARVAIERMPDRVVLTIRDNGLGFTPGTTGPNSGRGGFGLTGMAERARLLEGVLAIQSAPGRGTVVTVEFPMRRNVRA